MKYARKILYTSVFFTTLFSAVHIFAEEGDGSIDFSPLAPLLDITTGPDISLVVYLQQMFTLAIGLASILAVVMIVIGGIQYMTSEVVTDKSDAVKKIQGAVLGLLLAISSILILKTINPDLLNLDVIKEGVTVKGKDEFVSTEYCFGFDTTEEGASLPKNQKCGFAGLVRCQEKIEDFRKEKEALLSKKIIFFVECRPEADSFTSYSFTWVFTDPQNGQQSVDTSSYRSETKCETERKKKEKEPNTLTNSTCTKRAGSS